MPNDKNNNDISDISLDGKKRIYFYAIPISAPFANQRINKFVSKIEVHHRIL
jgi:hypothetical protein